MRFKASKTETVSMLFLKDVILDNRTFGSDLIRNENKYIY